MRRSSLDLHSMGNGCCHIDESETECSTSALHEPLVLSENTSSSSRSKTASRRYKKMHLIPVFLVTLAVVFFISGESAAAPRLKKAETATLVPVKPAKQLRIVVSPSPIRPLGPLAQQQAANYRDGSGLLVNLHVTHHGGTTFCNAVGRSAKGRAPRRACWIAQPQDKVSPDYPHHNPWTHDETAQNIQTARQSFHMISWEYEEAPQQTPLRDTNWEDPHMLSVFIARDPMKRLLAGDAKVNRDFPGILKNGPASRETWLAFSQSDHADNYALRILAGKQRGEPVTRNDLEAAKELLRRFSVVIDIECLSDSLDVLAKNEWKMQLGRVLKGRSRVSPRERIGHDDIYEALVTKNALDIELYEYAKQLSYLDCNSAVASKQ